MIHALTKQLIDRLATLSAEGRVEWTPGPSQNAFAFEAEGYSVVVEDVASGAMLVVSDGEGRELEALSADDLAEVRAPGGNDYETVVREMHAAARRAALGTDEAIGRILRNLDGEEPRERFTRKPFS